MKGAYYNEIDPYAAQWLRNLISAGHIPAGDVDTRSIVDVQPQDLEGYTQCHFFAGLGGWGYAARLADWPDSRPLWTGSAPCQPFSVAGKQAGVTDERHLWPHYFRLIAACRPATVMGEQVAAAVGKDWLDGVFADLEGVGYACGAAVVPACAVNAPHRRDRLWFVAGSRVLDHSDHARLERLSRHDGAASGWKESDRSAAATGRGSLVVDDKGERRSEGWAESELRSGRSATASTGVSDGAVRHAHQLGPSEGRPERSGQLGGIGGDTEGGYCGVILDDAESARRRRRESMGNGRLPQFGRSNQSNAWDSASWIIGHDGKARRVEPRIRLLAHGVPARVGKLRAYGNAIVPQVAAEVIKAYMDVTE